MTGWALAAGMLVAAGLVAVVWSFRQPQPDLKDAIARISPDQYTDRLTSQHVQTVAMGTRQDRLGRWAQRKVAHLPGMSAPTEDLELLGRSTTSFYGEKAAAALIGLIVVPAALSFLVLLGMMPPVVPPALGIALGVIFWLLPDVQVKKLAAQARKEFVDVAVAFLQIAAIKRVAGGAPVDTMLTSARVGNSWAMRRIRTTLSQADVSGKPHWDLLDDLGKTTRIPELSEVAGIMRLMGAEGAEVHGQLLARAQGIQQRITAAELETARAATVAMTTPMVLALLPFLLLIMIPTLQALSNS